jgi:hypothetical protein
MCGRDHKTRGALRRDLDGSEQAVGSTGARDEVNAIFLVIPLVSLDSHKACVPGLSYTGG